MRRWREVVRERDNTKARVAYLAVQSAQEAGQEVHWFEGVCNAVESFRLLAIQTQRQDIVPMVDILAQMANMFDPGRYEEHQDPLLLGVDISEECSEKSSSSETREEPAESSGDDMEGVVEGRGSRKRAWEGRWESAEDRDNAKGADPTQGGKEEEGPQEGEEDELAGGQRK